MFRSVSKKISNFVLDKLLPRPSRQEQEYISELQTTVRNLPEVKTTTEPSSETTWLTHINTLRDNILNRDPRRFLRWDVISETMFTGNALYISTEFEYLKKCSDWSMRWCSAIQESRVGHPLLSPYFPSSSGNLIHNAYHIAQFEEKTGGKIHDMKFAFEFGGGYGSMCRLLFNLGFNGKYIIFDLPPFSALQRYFLKNIGLSVRSIDDFKKSGTGIICLSDIQELNALLEGQTEINRSIFIATWSISETPMNIRESILPHAKEFDSFLIAYQDRFVEVNNIDFFNHWKDGSKSVIWNNYKIEHLPGSNYLMGRKLTHYDGR